MYIHLMLQLRLMLWLINLSICIRSDNNNWLCKTAENILFKKIQVY